MQGFAPCVNMDGNGGAEGTRLRDGRNRVGNGAGRVLFCFLCVIADKAQQELAEQRAHLLVGFCRGVYAVGAQFLEVVFVYPAFCPEVQHWYGKAFGAFYLRVHVVAHPARRVVFAQACAAVTV